MFDADSFGKPRILGVGASLRNSRRRQGAETLIDGIRACRSEREFREYLRAEGRTHLQNYIAAGRNDGLPFDKVYSNLRRERTTGGLSNSEAALAAALWAAARAGCEIDYVSLSEFFSSKNSARNIDQLKEHLRAADGILVSTPVYFGDRSSLSQSMVDLVRDDDYLRDELRNKVYAGIAVGAKRNGGQETTLIYQLMDMVNSGFLGVGNDSDTTSQYGGTGHAGDVGAMPDDDYGLWTSMGAGRRLAHVSAICRLGRETTLSGPVRIMFWVLQDRRDRAMALVHELVDELHDGVDATIIKITEKTIRRCIACDICPTRVDIDPVYRCVMRGGDDDMGDIHDHLLSHDAVVPVVYSSRDRSGLISNYQRFIERTRYLRRGDYVFSDCLTTPLVLEDLGVHQNMHIRMATSLLRHHTILTAPIVAYSQHGRLLNSRQVSEGFAEFVSAARIVAAGRLKMFANGEAPGITRYNPVGYVLSSAKNRDEKELALRARMVEERHARLAADARHRLAGVEVEVV
jgi:multimeric flavodoxin WrbA